MQSAHLVKPHLIKMIYACRYNYVDFLQETQSKITTLLQKEKSDARSPDANNNVTSSDAIDQPTTPNTQHGII